MSQSKYNTIIVDDEPLALKRLDGLLTQFTEVFSVVGHASNGTEAIKLINETKPDLVFLDIQMPGLNGFEILERLDEIPMIIFCTAYDQYSLQAFETNSIDYILKPVKKERLEQTIAKLSHFRNNFNPKGMLALMKQMSELNQKEMTSITIKNGAKIEFVKLSDIVYFKSCDKYVSLFTVAGDEKITEKTLSELEEKLPDYFLRIQRSYIINTRLVKEVQSHFNSRYLFVFNDYSKSKIASGRSYRDTVKSWMEI